MKYILSLLLSSILFLFFTGCALSPENKRDIYQSVTAEINNAMHKGDILYETGYYADAIKAYELVNYYEDRPVVPKSRIRSLQKSAKEYATIHYKRAMRIIETKKISALLELNKMLRYDPHYKDGKEQFEKLKQDVTVRKFLAKREMHLQKAMNENQKHDHYSKELDDAYQKLVSYDDRNLIAVKAYQLMQEQYVLGIATGITLFKKGKLSQAKKQFLSIQAIHKKDPTVKRYLEKINLLNQEKEDQTAFIHLLQSAKTAYDTKEYLMALEYAKKALEIDEENKEALKLFTQANESQKAMIPLLLSQAQEYYKEKNLNEALKIFNKILLTNPDNNTSKTYIRKIEHQLKTIESLK